MNKLFHIILPASLFLGSMLLAGCAQEIDSPDSGRPEDQVIVNPDGTKVIPQAITFGAVTGTDTKVAFVTDGGTPTGALNWSVGDQIAIYEYVNGVTTAPKQKDYSVGLTAEQIASSPTSAIISPANKTQNTSWVSAGGADSEPCAFYAYYPLSAANTIAEPTAGQKVTLPNVTAEQQGTLSDLGNYLICWGSDTRTRADILSGQTANYPAFAFSPKMAILHVTLTNNGEDHLPLDISQFVLTAKDGEDNPVAIVGDATLDLTNGAIVPPEASEETQTITSVRNLATLNYGASTNLYFAVLPNDNLSKLSFEIIATTNVGENRNVSCYTVLSDDITLSDGVMAGFMYDVATSVTTAAKRLNSVSITGGTATDGIASTDAGKANNTHYLYVGTDYTTDYENQHQTLQLEAWPIDSDGAAIDGVGSVEYSWTSSDESVAILSATNIKNPVVSAVAPGTSTISVVATLNDNVLEAVDYVINVVQPTITINGDVALNTTTGNTFVLDAPISGLVVEGDAVKASGDVVIAWTKPDDNLGEVKDIDNKSTKFTAINGIIDETKNSSVTVTYTVGCEDTGTVQVTKTENVDIYAFNTATITENANLQISKGKILQVSGFAYSDGTAILATDVSYNWTLNDGTACTLSGTNTSGVLLNAGTAIETVTATCQMTIQQIVPAGAVQEEGTVLTTTLTKQVQIKIRDVQSVSFNRDAAATIWRGNTADYTATITFGDGHGGTTTTNSGSVENPAEFFRFTSSNESVATVGTDGTITAVEAGVANITVTSTVEDAVQSASMLVYVNEVTGISLDKSSEYVGAWGAQTKTVTATYSYTSNGEPVLSELSAFPITWTADNESMVSASESTSGSASTITGGSMVGSTTLTATAPASVCVGGIARTASLTVANDGIFDGVYLSKARVIKSGNVFTLTTDPLSNLRLKGSAEYPYVTAPAPADVKNYSSSSSPMLTTGGYNWYVPSATKFTNICTNRTGATVLGTEGIEGTVVIVNLAGTSYANKGVTSVSGNTFAFNTAYTNYQAGVILYPDGGVFPTISGITNASGLATGNHISVATLQSLMQAGCVFIPYQGYVDNNGKDWRDASGDNGMWFNTVQDLRRIYGDGPHNVNTVPHNSNGHCTYLIHD